MKFYNFYIFHFLSNFRNPKSQNQNIRNSTEFKYYKIGLYILNKLIYCEINDFYSLFLL